MPSARSLVRTAARVALLAVLGAGVAGAQGVRVGSTERPRADDRSRPSAPGDPAGGPTALRMIVAGAPRSYQVVRVQVPPEVPASAAVHYRARPIGSATLISRAEGDLAPAGERGVSVVVGIPARARAGRFPAAEVTFTADSVTATVIVDMEVSLVHSFNLAVLRPTVGARPGQVVRLPYQLVNRGNASDTVSLHVETPATWGTLSGGDSAILVLEPGVLVERELVTRVAKMASSGSYTLRFRLRGDSTELANELATVDVIGPSPTLHPDGLTLSTGLGIATGASGGKTAVMQYSLTGPLVNGLYMQTDVTTSTSLTAKDRYRLSSLGQLPQPPNFSLYTGRWRATAGAVGFAYSEVMGLNVGGRGGSFAYEGPRFAGQALLGKGATTDSSTPLNAAARLGMRVGGDWFSATALRIRDGMGEGRQLKSVGASFLDPKAWGGQFTSEVAFRQFTGGSGVGMLADYTRIAGPESRMQLHGSYAPGGTNAFALARTSLNATLTRRLTGRSLVDGQLWFSEDATGSASSHNFGITAVPQFQLGHERFLNFDVGSRVQAFTSNGTGFGLAEHRANGTYRWGGLGLLFSAGGGGALLTRSVSLDTLVDSRRSFLRTSLSGDITKGTVRFGSLTVASSFSNDQSNLTTLPRELRFAVGVSQFPIYFYGGFNLRLTGLVEHISWLGARPSAIAYHGDVTADLPLGFTVAWAMDRRPFEAIPGAGSWATSLRIGRRGSFSIPTPLRRGNRSGTVYQDLNGNGMREKGEPGIGGIMVLRGPERVSTDEAGRYHFSAPRGGTVSSSLRLEPRSIPPGWLDRPVSLEKGKASKVADIGLVPMANVRVVVDVSHDDLGASGALDLSKVIVSARDSAGRLWIAAREPTGSHIFPALPPGTYKLDVDPSALGVPLSLKEEVPPFVVGQNRESQTIRVELATRKVRMFRGSAAPTPTPAKP